MTENSRIWFIDNPWPDGHAIGIFNWSGRLAKDGFYFHLSLESEDYCEGDEEEEEDESESSDDDESTDDWHAKIVWNNYHHCIMSTSEWGDATGLLVGTESEPITMSSLSGKVFRADTLPIDPDAEPACRVYLLGHDSVADHTLTFGKRYESEGKLIYDIEWNGKLALTYAGDDEFKYSFTSKIAQVTFEDIEVDEDVSPEEAPELLARFLKDADKFELDESGSYMSFSP